MPRRKSPCSKELAALSPEEYYGAAGEITYVEAADDIWPRCPYCGIDLKVIWEKSQGLGTMGVPLARNIDIPVDKKHDVTGQRPTTTFSVFQMTGTHNSVNAS